MIREEIGEKRHETNNRPLPIDREIKTIFWGPHIAFDFRNHQHTYTREAKEPSLTNVLSLDQRPTKVFKRENEPITFTEEDSQRVHFPYNDPLVITVQIANMKVHRTLINTRSLVDIFYYHVLK